MANPTRPESSRQASITPLVTVIMPTRNEAAYVSRSLGSVLAQDYPCDRLEILAVDGMSTDGTRAVAEELGRSRPELALRLIDNPGRIVPTGMNIGLRQARGDVVVRVDGHTVIRSDYVRLCVETLARTDADNVGGRMDAAGVGSFGEAVATATSTPFGVGDARFHYSDKEEWVDTVYMGAWPRRVFEEIGLFDEELVRDQDDEFNYRLRENGGKILLSPEIKSVYTNRSSPAALWKQYFQYGFWKVRVMQKHPKQMSPRQFVPPLFAFCLCLCLCLTVIFPWGWTCLAAVAGCYAVPNLAASVATASKKGWRHAPLLPVVYAILHLSYGLGFLVGLFKFWKRWGDKKGKVPEFKPRETGDR